MSDYCFVLGCARSGTTALTRLLHSHEAIVMGMERYKYMLNPGGIAGFLPELFEPDRFLDFRDTDTNITPEVERFRRHYEMAAERLRSGSVKYIGDKIAARQVIVAGIQRQFPSFKVVFIYRDLLRVASSFCVRARNPNDTEWPEENTHELALARWQEAFSAADLLIDSFGTDGVFPVRYERLFDGERRSCEAMFGFLGLDVTADVTRQFVAATAAWDEHETKPIELSDAQQAYLLDCLDVAVVERFDTEFERQVERFAPR